MRHKWIFILPIMLVSICYAQTFRRNYEFPSVGGAIPIGALADDSILIDDVADGDWGGFTISSNSATIDADTLSVSMMADGDWGDFTITSNVASLDPNVVAASELAAGDYGDITISTAGVITIDAGVVALADLVAGGTTGDMLYWSGSAWIADTAPVVADGGGPSLGSGKGGIKFKDLAGDIIQIHTAILQIQQQVDDFPIVDTTIIGTLEIYGDDDTASADEIAFQLVTTATSTWTDGDEDSRAELSVLNNGVMNNDQLVLATDGTVTTSGAFIPTDLVIPQASPAVPAVDGGVEIDFTDGTLVVQHGSAHAELASATDVVVGKLVKSFSATLAMPDDLQGEIDYWPLKHIKASEFPHGIVITEITMVVSENTSYTINVENWDDFDTINGANPTIDAVAYTADTTGEVTEDAITYATIAAGQIIMLDLPTTDVGWVQIDVQYYEPAG